MYLLIYKWQSRGVKFRQDTSDSPSDSYTCFLLLLNYKHYIEGFVERIYAQIHAVSYDIKYACVPYVLRPLRLTIVELMDWEEEFVKYIWHFNKK